MGGRSRTIPLFRREKHEVPHHAAKREKDYSGGKVHAANVIVGGEGHGDSSSDPLPHTMSKGWSDRARASCGDWLGDPCMSHDQCLQLPFARRGAQAPARHRAARDSRGREPHWRRHRRTCNHDYGALREAHLPVGGLTGMRSAPVGKEELRASAGDHAGSRSR
jgi:hypothetical protein